MVNESTTAAELQHPRVFFGRLSKDRDEVKILAEHGVVPPSVGPENLVAVHDLLNLLETPSAERSRNQSQRRRPLGPLSSPMLSPARGTIRTGGLDHFTRCSIFAVAVCAAAALATKQIKANTRDCWLFSSAQQSSPALLFSVSRWLVLPLDARIAFHNAPLKFLRGASHLRHNRKAVLRGVVNPLLCLMVVATFLWGGCVSCEQFFMFPGKKQPCCNKSGQCERPGKTSSQPEKQDCNRLPFGPTGNTHPVPLPAILPTPAAFAIAQPPSATTSRLVSSEELFDPSPPDRQALYATFLI